MFEHPELAHTEDMSFDGNMYMPFARDLSLQAVALEEGRLGRSEEEEMLRVRTTLVLATRLLDPCSH